MPKARRHSDGLGSGLARARGVAAGLFVESKWILTIKSVVSQGDKFCLPRRQIRICLPGRQILSPGETVFQRNCGKGRGAEPLRDVSPAAALARARSLSG